MKILLTNEFLREIQMLTESDDPLGRMQPKKDPAPPSQDVIREFLKTIQDFENRPRRYMSTEGFLFKVSHVRKHSVLS